MARERASASTAIGSVRLLAVHNLNDTKAHGIVFDLRTKNDGAAAHPNPLSMVSVDRTRTHGTFVRSLACVSVGFLFVEKIACD